MYFRPNLKKYAPFRRLILAVFLVSFLCLLINVLLFSSSMYSPLNDAALSKRLDHDQRLKEASAFVKRLPVIDIGPGFGANDVKLPVSIVVLSKTRAQPYINLFFWSLIEFNSVRSIAATHLSVLNTERPSSDNVALRPFRELRGLHVIDQLPERTSKPPTPLRGELWICQQVLDYVVALKECERTRGSWCIIMEGDVLPTRQLLDKFQALVSEELRGDEEKVAFVKLFVTDHWNGFALEGSFLLDQLKVIIASVLLVRVLWFFLAKRDSHRERLELTRCQFLLASTILFVGLNLAWRIAGRQHIHNLFYGPEMRLSRCFQAAGNVAIAFVLMYHWHCKRLTIKCSGILEAR